MQQAITLLERFTDGDAEWLLAAGHERDMARGDVVIEAGQDLDELYVVVQGLLGVFADEVGTQLATVGPGELLGEMAFVTASPPTETVRALENATVLAVPFASLAQRGDDEPAFSARLHRALAQLLAIRLRLANSRSRVQARADDVRHPPGWSRLSEPIERFKQAVFAANEEAAENDDEIPETTRDGIVEQFHGFCRLLNEVMTRDIDNERVREEVATRLQHELLPYILLTETAERFYTKPRGYAGDFLTLEMIYRNEPGGQNAVGRLIDHCILDTSAARAVRHRRGLLTAEIDAAIASRPGETTHITSLACGPAREVFDAFSQLDDPTSLHANLLDIDLQALAFVSDKATSEGLGRRMSFVSENLIRLALGRSTSDIRDQDLVYSIGLIDYLGDDLVVRLMDLVHGMLRPGGRIILGNIHPRNSTRGLMDHVLDWKLVHRTEQEMDRLFEASAFGRPSTNIRFEDEGINLFAECVR
jgi:extracellular factor (EF) 3-hydroxypalmitic acid methyl ester biosynthesis protein